MATQKCPRCGSERIRHGYRSTSIFKKLTFRYNLLCDDCNWEFVGFAIPGMVPDKTARKKRTKPALETPEPVDENIAERSATIESRTNGRRRIKRKVKI